MRRFSEFKRFLYKEFTPITKSLLLISAAVSLLILFFPPINYLLSLIPRTLIYQPWTLLTYPLVNNLSLSLVFAIIWFWYIGGVLERGWGSQSYGLFLVLVTLVTGGALSLVSAIFFQGRIAVSGLWIPLVGLTWAWAELHPEWEVLFWGLFPVRAKLLAWILAGGNFFSYLQAYRGIHGLFLGLASVSGILVVYLFSGGGPFSRGIRYWAWKKGFSYAGWKDKMKERFRRRRMRVIK